MESVKYSLLVIAATFLGIIVLPWWATPILIMVIAYFTNETRLNSVSIAFLATMLCWILIAMAKDSTSLGKVSEVTGAILLGMSKSTLYLITGLTISIVSGLMALAGKQLKSLITSEN